jgi:hypothetical protein
VIFPRTRYWFIGRRVALIFIAVIVGYRSYGDTVANWFRGPDPSMDIVITQSEFLPAPDGDRPLWFIGLRNESASTTYDQIVMEATYMDALGATTEVDRIIVSQRLGPGEQQDIGSLDRIRRDRATTGTLRILDAQVVE